MPFVTYFAARAKSKTLTASDVMELIGGSTYTQGVAHPPHPHAHIAKEGFSVGGSLNAMEKLELQTLRTAPQPRPQNDEARYVTLLARETYEEEGMHIDPALRGGYSQKEYEVIDGKQLYINRPLHSQFQDSESAVLALYHSLNSPAGQKALSFLAEYKEGRAVIHSLTSANALKAGVLPYKDPPKKLSAHPDRGNVAQLVKRGAGPSGAAPVPLAPFVAITTVLDNNDGNLVVQTHYPAHAAPDVPDINGNEENLAPREYYEKLISLNKQRIKAINAVVAANNKNATFVNAINNLVADQWIKDFVLTSQYMKGANKKDERGAALKEIQDMNNANATYKLKLKKNVVAANDYVDARRDEDINAKLNYVHFLYKFAPGAFAKVPAVAWTNKEPKILGFGVNSAGQACAICGQVHGATPSLINKWLQCNSCGASYCPTHSNTLLVAVVAKGPPGKQCKTMNCKGVARWVY